MPSKTTRRRPKGEGSIIVLPSGKVRVRVELDPVDGKRRWLSATADTKKEAVEKLKKLQRDKEDSVLQCKAQEDTIMYQLEVYKRHLKALKRSGAILRHLNLVCSDLDTYTNGVSLPNLKGVHIDGLLLQWHNRGLQQSTINLYVSKLRGFFEWAVANDLMKKNLLADYKAKTQRKKSKHNLVVLSLAEHQQIKDYLYTFWERKRKPIKKWSLKFRMYALYCLAYETGMRDGEIAVLTWKDIDLDNNIVNVNKTLSIQEDTKATINEPKTDAGFRRIKISEKTTQLLADLKDFSSDLSDYVFYNHKTHSFYSGGNINGVFQQVLSAVGITRHLTFHDIRHTNASNMIHNKVPIAVITERLGHSSIAVTYSAYGHIIQECAEANMAVIEA